MYLIYISVAAPDIQGGNSNCSGVKTEVYYCPEEGKSERVFCAEHIMGKSSLELLYLKELSSVLDRIDIDKGEHVVLYTTRSIAEHGTKALFSAGKYPNAARWDTVVKKLRPLVFVPQFRSDSEWGETLLSETKEMVNTFAATH